MDTNTEERLFAEGRKQEIQKFSFKLFSGLGNGFSVTAAEAPARRQGLSSAETPGYLVHGVSKCR